MRARTLALRETRLARMWLLGLFALSALILMGATAARGQVIGTPALSGDQLIFLYDARTDRVTFLSIANPGDDAIAVEVAFYSADLQNLLVAEILSLAGAANVVIDPTTFGGGDASGNAGLAVVTPVLAIDDTTPVVPPYPIVGGFTLANLNLMSGFGQNPMGRLAVNDAGVPATPGSTVDGIDVLYERFDPSVLMVPVYFNPATLGPPENDGNRVLLVAFADNYGNAFGVLPVSTTVTSTFFNAAGSRLGQNTTPINGVLLSDLQSMAGETSLDGSSGKAFFQLDTSGGNAFGLFSQSVGTFAAGQRMPEVGSVPAGAGPPVAVTLNFDARVNGDQFACNRTFSNIGSTNATIEPTDCRLYIENIRLVNEDGAEVPLQLTQDEWLLEDVALLDFEDGTGLCGQRGTTATNTNISGQVPQDTYNRLKFEMGVPEHLNHGDSASAPSPLNKTALFWSWNAGYKFIRYDNVVQSNGNEFRVHIGSTNCTGDGRGNATCGNSNRIEVDLAFSAASDVVVIDLASFFVGTDVASNTGAPGCMSDADDPECVGVFSQAGLPYGGAPGGVQQIFDVEPGV